ncbi:hypothetical protein SETIT_9G489800v2 [Setaria italica]|uniref:Uncharacterized protein n=2 Tax=Setaria TaxID=4554 RepID=A0A368SU17_SETIT|nr:hypothetical protein SETIT_9G489800v2 [Setaria italica]TKV97430.1 hypothetical protein SEVIR_9G493800v2 [Setaria viridis]
MMIGIPRSGGMQLNDEKAHLLETGSLYKYVVSILLMELHRK